MQQPSYWLGYFLANKNSHSALCWSGERSDSETQQQALAKSLSHFQLGESGDGVRMRGLAVKYGEDYAHAVALFVKEENRHAQILSECVSYLGGNLISKHWTEHVFVFLRRFLTLRFEVEVLATAEIVGLAFYALIGERTKDERIRAMCSLFLQEETKHLEFDADSIIFLENSCPNFLFRCVSFFIFVGTMCAAWIDHGAVLKMYGGSFGDWWRMTGRLYKTFALRRDGFLP